MQTLKIVVMFLTAMGVQGAVSVPAADINNPAATYGRYTDRETGELDSVILGTAFFDPLPEYRKETRLVVEHYAWFDTENGLVFKAVGQGVVRAQLEMKEYLVRVPGPIKRGDTVSAEFFITPIKVGKIEQSFAVYDDLPWDPEKMRRHAGNIRADFALGPDGNTFAAMSPKVDARNATSLGPEPELISGRGLKFLVDPRPQSEIVYPDRIQSILDNPDKHIFSIEITPQMVNVVPAEIVLHCNVVPYHGFEKGIGFIVYSSEDLLVREISPSIVGPVVADRSYEFSVTIKTSRAGVGVISLIFATPNPDYGKEVGVFAPLTTQCDLRSGLTLYIGMDDNGRLLFLSDRRPDPDRPLESLSITEVDSRYGFVQAHGVTSGTRQKVKGEGFDQIIVKPSSKIFLEKPDGKK